MIKTKSHEKFYGVFKINNKYATINLTTGENVYGEGLIKTNNTEYRLWDYTRSKPAAAFKCGLKIWPLGNKMKILYLGAGSGTTCSHFSDIIGKEGLIYAVDIAEKPLRDLVRVAEVRGNIVPILADSRKPETYENIVVDKVDLVYEDVASPDQIPILVRNVEKYLKINGHAMIAIKSQSIDVVKPPKKVYQECLHELEKYFEVLDKVELDPYEKFHLFSVMKWKK